MISTILDLLPTVKSYSRLFYIFMPCHTIPSVACLYATTSCALCFYSTILFLFYFVSFMYANLPLVQLVRSFCKL